MAHPTPGSIRQRLDRIERMLRFLIREDRYIMAAKDDLKAEVARDTDTVSSAVTLLKGLHDQLAAAIAAGDPAAIQAMADQLKANTDALAAAVVANTAA